MNTFRPENQSQSNPATDSARPTPSADELNRHQATLDETIRRRVSRISQVVERDAAVPEQEISELKRLLDLRGALALVHRRRGDRRWRVIALYGLIAGVTAGTFFVRVSRTDISLIARAPLVAFRTDQDFRDNGSRLAFRNWHLDADTTASSSSRLATVSLDFLPRGTTIRLGRVAPPSAREPAQLELVGIPNASLTLELQEKGGSSRLDTIQQMSIDSAWTFTGTPVEDQATLPEYIRIRELFMLDPGAQIALDQVVDSTVRTQAHVLHGTLELISLRPPRTHELGNGDMLVLYGAEGRLTSAIVDSQAVTVTFTGSVKKIEAARDTAVISLMPTWYDVLASQSFLAVLFTVTTTVGALVLAFLRWWPQAE